MAAASWGEGDTGGSYTPRPPGSTWLNGNGPEQPSSLGSAPWMSPPVGGVYVAKGRLSILGGPDDAGAALPPEATLELRADPSVGRIRLLCCFPSVGPVAAAGRAVCPRTDVCPSATPPAARRTPGSPRRRAA